MELLAYTIGFVILQGLLFLCGHYVVMAIKEIDDHSKRILPVIVLVVLVVFYVVLFFFGRYQNSITLISINGNGFLVSLVCLVFVGVVCAILSGGVQATLLMVVVIAVLVVRGKDRNDKTPGLDAAMCITLAVAVANVSIRVFLIAFGILPYTFASFIGINI